MTPLNNFDSLPYGTLDVRDYGATGNGTTDDAAAIQAALAAIPVGGGTVLLPPGSYKTTGPLTIAQDDTKIEGQGAILECAFAGIVLSTDAHSHVRIRGLSIDGNALATVGLDIQGGLHVFEQMGITACATGVYGFHCWNEAVLRECQITQCSAYGVHLNSCNTPRLDGVDMFQNAEHVYLQDCYKITMLGCVAQEGSGVSLRIYQGGYHSIISNWFEANDQAGGAPDVIYVDGANDNARSVNNTIVGNQISQSTGNGINLRYSTGAFIANNYISMTAGKKVVEYATHTLKTVFLDDGVLTFGATGSYDANPCMVVAGNRWFWNWQVPTTYSHKQGDVTWNFYPSAGGAPGWVCTHSGTFSEATDATGDTDGTTAVITGMTDTSDFSVGDFVDVSAGFASTGPYEIISKTASSITLDTVSNAVATNITVDTSDPVFKAMASLAA